MHTLFITKNKNQNFNKIKFQIDNIFNIRIKIFIIKKKTEIINSKF